MKLRTRLALLISGLLALSVGLSAGGLYLMERSYLKGRALEQVRLVGDSAERAVQDALLYEDRVALVSYFNFLKRQWPALAHVRARWSENGAPREIEAGAPRPDLLSETRTLRHPKTGAEVALETGFDRGLLDEQLASSLARLRGEAAWVLAAAVLLGGGLTAALTAAFVRPLSDQSQAAQRIGQGRLGERLDYRRRDEVGRLVEAFNRMSEKLEELDQMKRDFVSATTHELRSPLAAIESLLNVLRERQKEEGPVPEADLREYLSRVAANVRRLSLFVDNVLDAAKLERGKMELVCRPLELEPAFEDVVRLFEARYREKGVALKADAAGLAVLADLGGLERVLVNLVANALKFTPSGGSVDVTAQADGAGVTVAVRDTGVGIPPRDLEGLFQKFSQGSNVREIALGRKGTGLGLYVVRSIVEAMGGTVGVRSEPGAGTTFSVVLKAARAGGL